MGNQRDHARPPLTSRKYFSAFLNDPGRVVPWTNPFSGGERSKRGRHDFNQRQSLACPKARKPSQGLIRIYFIGHGGNKCLQTLAESRLNTLPPSADISYPRLYPWCCKPLYARTSTDSAIPFVAVTLSTKHPTMAPAAKKEKRKTRSALSDVVTREYTIHLHKRVHGHGFKKRAPRAVKSIVQFAQKAMGTSDVRLDPKLNEAVWKQGVKNVPHRLRIKLERKRNDDEDAKEKLYTYASPVHVESFKGLQTVVVDAE
ncbi:60S ribosomal protein L31 [Tulasnella sp. 419]|nr:60S ribosomal protein L31 [Tulasnella sp. 419]